MARGVFDAVGYEDLLIVVKYSSGYLATTDQPEDMLFFYKHLSLGGGLYKVPKDLLVYRYVSARLIHQLAQVSRHDDISQDQPDYTHGLQSSCFRGSGPYGRKWPNITSTDSVKARVVLFYDLGLR